jgi:peptidoglycan/LPS O-acetylase OafA/YrhL
VEANTKHRFGALDSLRGVCACMIVVYHFRTTGLISSLPLIHNAFLFVDFFFVLSGFVIASSYGNKLAGGFPIGRFMLLRLGRVYPLHLVVLAVFVLFELATTQIPQAGNHVPFSGDYSPGLLVANIGLVQTFVGPDGTSWNGPAWSIAVEVWAYLVFAVGFSFLGRYLVPVAALIATACAVYLLLLTDRYLNVFHDGALARCLLGFSIGVLCFYAFPWIPRIRQVGLATVTEVTVVLATIAAVSIAGATPLSVAVPLVFAVTILVFAQQGGLVSRALLTRGPLFLGKISFSIYMVHLFIVYRAYNVLELAQRRFGATDLVRKVNGEQVAGADPIIGDTLSALMLVTVIVVAAVSYELIEAPANAWARRKILGVEKAVRK